TDDGTKEAEGKDRDGDAQDREAGPEFVAKGILKEYFKNVHCCSGYLCLGILLYVPFSLPSDHG
ncbi:MAG: hypothetical protein H6Q54_1110, partial [Deltaproteobacteria bacterium]|nr:hypothetical protein [Deltaproteobacteria bacterium]